MEKNGGIYNDTTQQWEPTTSVTIQGITYYDITDYYFLGVRSASIYDGNVASIKLVDSSVNLYNCFSDPTGNYYYNIDVDANSSLIAYEHKYRYTTSENIYVNSIGYDGSSDIWHQPAAFTSVWGPLRTTLMAGLTNVVLSQPMFKGD